LLQALFYFFNGYLTKQTEDIMIKNMGTADKIIRIILAIIFAVLYFTETVTGTVGIILLVLGAVFVITSLTGFCGLYKLFGLNTCKVDPEKS
jgi:uncharacterized membrane protein